MDIGMLQWMVEHRSAWLTVVFLVVTTAGNTVWMFVWASAGCAALLTSGRRADAVLVAGSMLTGWGVMNAVKLIVGRERPPEPERLVDVASHAFPSGHAMVSALLATLAIAVMLRSRTLWLHNFTLLAVPIAATLVIGMSRIYLGAHWTTDVLAGWILGALWGLLWISVFSRISVRNRFAGLSRATRRASTGC
ncbi:MAG: phosphatase PAP2 family protein [Rhodococcus sp. (in: high G+C Gram-positive bacteria)]